MIKKVQKPQAQIEAERREAQELSRDILAMSNRIPKHILNNAFHGQAVQFKEHLALAVKAANAKTLDVHKLRSAYNLIIGYYKSDLLGA